jgi:hypothetical protein
MRLPIFLLLLAAAMVATGVALRLAVSTRQRDGVATAVGLSAGAAALWLLISTSALNVVTVSNGVEIVHSYPSLGIFGVVGVGVSVLIMGRGSVELIGGR